jgi:hypothetical protein
VAVAVLVLVFAKVQFVKSFRHKTQALCKQNLMAFLVSKPALPIADLPRNEKRRGFFCFCLVFCLFVFSSVFSFYHRIIANYQLLSTSVINRSRNCSAAPASAASSAASAGQPV